MPISSASRNCRTWSSLRRSKPSGHVESVCREYSLDRQPNGTVTDGGHPGFGFTGRPEVLDALDERSQQRLGLEKRKYPAHTGMNPVAEPEVIPIVSDHVESVRRIPAAGIAVGAGGHQSATLTG